MKLFWKIIYELRNIIAFLPLAFALTSTRWEWENDWGIWTAALSIGALGILLRAWAASHCRYGHGKRTGRLTTTGPYAYVRNPLYVGNTLILTAATVASELVWLVPGTVAWALIVYSGAAQREEAKLRRKYGAEYTTYCSETPRWIPSLRSLSETPRWIPSLRSLSGAPVLPFILRELRRLIILLPFVLKELNVFNLWQ